MGGKGPDEPVGVRGDVCVLSFGRGKSLAALGGGAAAWWGGLAPPRDEGDRRTGTGWAAAARAVLYDVALRAYLSGEPTLPGASEFCARLLALATRAGLRGARREWLIRALEDPA
jgi:hypothetical protein